MTSDAKRRFVLALRSLDGPAFVDFVAALWTARGWRTIVEAPDRFEATDEAGRESSTLRVVGTGAATASFLARPNATDVVVTRGPVGRAAVHAVRLFRPDVGFEHVDASDLYERFAYAIGDADRRRLRERHLRAGAEHPTLGARISHGTERARGIPQSRRVRTTLSSRTLAAVAVLLLVVVGATTPLLVGPQFDRGSTSRIGDDVDGGGGAPTWTRTGTTTPTPIPAALDLPSACPPPPADAHPVLIRPGVVRTASTSGLEGWQVVLDGNLTDFDPNDERRSVFPPVRHFIVYESPSGRQYRLSVDRWRSPDRAMAQVQPGEKSGADAVLVWGSYVVTARASADDAPDLARSDVRQLLANLQQPSGVRLGYQCADALTTPAQRWSNRSR
ncbi:hypothetical protein HUG10_06950 [Halorarum halophilum]|uniref:Uncharacterized protein n=1 Tax=Halorarum halophilum TaxID=2743090 RepID=A0A7D5KUC4_9EURY|nr:hypothetical protein [Halobaculum halophilum]QLG27300.1 hypothetical protein HUG10_06950 [Halobaculum halophilum]